MLTALDVTAACRRTALCAALGMALSLGATIPLGAHAQTRAAREAPVTHESLIGALEAQARFQPRAALTALDALSDEVAPHSLTRIELLAARGRLLALQRDAVGAQRQVSELERWPRDAAQPQALAAIALVRGLMAAEAGDLQGAYQTLSDAQVKVPAEAQRLRWRVMLALGRNRAEVGLFDDALAALLIAVRLGDTSGEVWRAVESRLALAQVYLRAGRQEAAKRLTERAMRIAGDGQDSFGQAGAHHMRAMLLRAGDDLPAAQHEMGVALELAVSLGADALQGVTGAGLAELHLAAGDARRAHAVATTALTAALRSENRIAQAKAQAQVGLAEIALGQTAPGKARVAGAIKVHEQRGAKTTAGDLYRALGAVLEKTGDLPAAVQAYHRWRAIDDVLRERDRQVAFADIQSRADAESRATEIALLQRDNVIKDELLKSDDLQRNLSYLLTLAALLLFAIYWVEYRRLKQRHRKLARANSALLGDTETDTLTGLANRRHWQRVTEGAPSSGTLFMLDVDRFKRINDTQGHAAGDAVLKAVAQRLREALREPDQIVRWGGEEFLVRVASDDPALARTVAQRILDVMAQSPVVYEGVAKTITVSLGFANIAAVPGRATPSWEQAIALVDSAMYQAKTQGRNRAIGVGAWADAALGVGPQSIDEAWASGAFSAEVLHGPAQLQPI